jgi:FG-GAP-like repeat
MFCGCAPGRGVLVVTVRADARVAAIDHLEVTARQGAASAQPATWRADGGQPFDVPPEQTLALLFGPDRTGPTLIEVAARSAAGATLARGSSDAMVLASGRTDVTITLGGGAMPDGGADLSGGPADLSGADLAPRPSFAPAVALPAIANLFGITSGDWNGDGRPDLALTRTQPAGLLVLLNAGGGAFGAPTTYNPCPSFYGITSADFDADGKPDLAAVCANGGATVGRGAGDGTFQFGPSMILGASPYSLLATDLDRDGKRDLLATDQFADSLAVRRGNGDLTFANVQSFPTQIGPDYLVAVDLDEDSWPDVVTSNFSETLSVLLGDRLGGLSAPKSIALAAATNPHGLIAADLDGDQHADIATAMLGANTVELRWGDGKGALAAPQELVTGAGAFQPIAADFDRDGRLDLAVAATSDRELDLYRNLGGRSFTPAETFRVAPGPTGLAAADFDGDGRLDLAVAGQGGVVILINQIP